MFLGNLCFTADVDKNVYECTIIDSLFGRCCCLFYTALPTPIVDIVLDGANIPGQALSLICVVYVVDRLVVQPLIVWEKYASNESVSANNISVEPSRDGNNSTLSFLSLRTSDAGLYTCRATLVIDSINVIMTTEETQDITLQSKKAWTLIFSLILIAKHQSKCFIAK